VAAVIVAATAIWLLAYRWFLLISIAIGATWREGCICGTSCVQCAMMRRRTSGRWGWGRKQGAGAK
jgi:hypothetical protein